MVVPPDIPFLWLNEKEVLQGFFFFLKDTLTYILFSTYHQFPKFASCPFCAEKVAVALLIKYKEQIYSFDYAKNNTVKFLRAKKQE